MHMVGGEQPVGALGSGRLLYLHLLCAWPASKAVCITPFLFSFFKSLASTNLER